MSLDHTDFVTRYLPQSKDAPTRRLNARRFWVSLAMMLVYIGICAGLAIMMGVDRMVMLAAAGSFVLASVIGFFAQRVLYDYSTHEKERRLIRQVFDHSRGARLITDGAGKVVYTNERFQDLFGAIVKDPIDMLAGLFSQNAEAHAHFTALAEQARKGLQDSLELKSIQDGREIWYSIAAQPIADWAGYIHWRIDDVTLLHQRNRDISEERTKLIDFTDNAPVGFFSVDENGKFVFVNATLARWLGVDIQTLMTRDYLHAYLVDAVEGLAPYDIVEGGGSRQVAEISMKGAGGRVFLASINQTVVFEEDGRVRTRAVVHDLTAEREMKQALQASEDRFEKFFEDAPLGIALVDSEGIVRDCNSALSRMLGMPVSVIEGQTLKMLLSFESQEQALSALSKIMQGDEGRGGIEIRLKGRDRDVAVQMHARKISGSKQVVLHFIDLSEQKRLEAQFVQSQKMQAVGQLAGGVAHDFNNLLTAIIGFCDLLLLRHKPGDPSFADIMQIKQNSNRAANLVRQLLAFSRQQTLRPKVQDITDILTEVSHLIRRLIGANIELDVRHGTDLGLVKVDAGQMEQVLVNLSVNARDAMEQGGKLSISTRSVHNTVPIKCCDDEMPVGTWTAIQVSDTGCGISADNMSRILEPFFTTKDIGKGTGLGLATVYGIVRQTGGYLQIESTVGIGTTFTIYLPRATAEESAQAEAAKVPENEPVKDLTGAARILLVEDEDAVRAFSTRALTNKGYEVLGAESGEAALSLLETEDIQGVDLMITDVMMPGMDGPTMATKVRAMKPDLKVIFISGYTEDRLKDHMGKNIFFLPKPFTLKQLAEKVKEALES